MQKNTKGHNNSFVDFLRSHGPINSVRTRYDEHNQQAYELYKVDPQFEFKQPLLEKVVENFTDPDQQHNIILSGTAVRLLDDTLKKFRNHSPSGEG